MWFVLRNAKNAGTNFYAWYTGGKDLSQATKDWFTQSVVMAGQLDKYSKTYNSKHYEMDKRIDAVRDSFFSSMGYTFDGTAFASTRRQPFYRDLKEAIYFKSKPELEKQVWKTYNFLINRLKRH